jgi:hypothetical protein
MPDRVKDPLKGPDGIFATDLPPTRGDWHSLAVLLCHVLRVQVPRSRYDATTLAVRLTRRLATSEAEPSTERTP